MDYELTQKLQKELSSGESLLWFGRPQQGMVLHGSDAFLIPFSLLWGGFALFWEFSAYRSGAPPFFLLFGGFFVVIGLYFIFGRFIADSMIRGRTYYAVTNDRVLILSEFPARRLKSLNLRTLTDITFTSKPNGIGTITFGPTASWMDGVSWPVAGFNRSPRFELIENVKSVYDIIRDAQKKAT